MRFSFPLVLLLLFAPAALAETRVALVIGNSAYKHAPALANPKNDAEGMAAALRRLKFEVLAGTDLDKPAMEKLLQAFAQKLDTADVALVFYAGHGLQVHGRNYLVPIDGKLDRESDLPFQSVPLDLVQGLMEQGQRTNIMILDACRDNPLARNLARTMGTRSVGIGRGLGEAKAGIGTLIVYATQPGNVALDGEGKNSPFTLSLLKHMEAPGLEIRQVLTRVRNEVITATRDKQVPWDSSSLRGDFFFAAAPAARETPAPGPAPATPQADGDIVFWQSIQNSKNAADYKAYLQKYPSGTFAELAKLRIAEIEKAAAVTPPAPAPEKPAPPARTSSFQAAFAVNRTASKKMTLGNPKTATPQQCRAMCIANPRCVAWDHYTTNYHAEKQSPYHLECSLFSTFGGIDANSLYHAGVIRTTAAPAARPAAPKPQPGTASPAQPGSTPAVPLPQSGDALVRELLRKATANEPENGFCSRVSWPSWTGDGLAFVRLGERGGTHLYKHSREQQCGLNRVYPEVKQGEIRCRPWDRWICQVGGNCSSLKGMKFCEAWVGHWKQNGL